MLNAVTAEIATSLAATHRLRPAATVHLVTVLVAGTDRFITDTRRDFPDTLTDDVTYPDTLPDPHQCDAPTEQSALALRSARTQEC